MQRIRILIALFIISAGLTGSSNASELGDLFQKVKPSVVVITTVNTRVSASPEKAAKALVKEKIDVFIHDAPVIWWLAAEKELDGIIPLQGFLNQEYIAWAVRHEDKDLLDSANTFISEWNSDGRMKAVINKWIPYAFK
jgi:ABC-type amino acid transport substrate-binding protein